MGDNPGGPTPVCNVNNAVWSVSERDGKTNEAFVAVTGFREVTSPPERHTSLLSRPPTDLLWGKIQAEKFSLIMSIFLFSNHPRFFIFFNVQGILRKPNFFSQILKLSLPSADQLISVLLTFIMTKERGNWELKMLQPKGMSAAIKAGSLYGGAL